MIRTCRDRTVLGGSPIPFVAHRRGFRDRVLIQNLAIVVKLLVDGSPADLAVGQEFPGTRGPQIESGAGR